jgi:hypothetical protein
MIEVIKATNGTERWLTLRNGVREKAVKETVQNLYRCKSCGKILDTLYKANAHIKTRH